MPIRSESFIPDRAPISVGSAGWVEGRAPSRPQIPMGAAKRNPSIIGTGKTEIFNISEQSIDRT
jgi:hypothetical protein